MVRGQSQASTSSKKEFCNMAYEQKDNSGTLFNAKEKRSENSPDMDGMLIVNGRKFWIKAWRKQGKSGEFLSLSIKDAEQGANEIRQGTTFEKPARSHGAASGSFDRQTGELLDDEIPF
jgi:hypothetical protein